MNQFTIGGAWAKGFGFFSEAAGKHALLLIVMGVVAPLALQILVTGGPMGTASPAMLGGAIFSGRMLMMGLVLILLGIGTYLLQLGSYFASWRLGFDRGESVGGAIGFGLLAGLLLLLVAVALIAVIAVSFASAGSTAGVVVAFLVAIPLMLLFAALYTAMMSAVAIGMIVGLLLTAAIGASLSSLGPAMGGRGPAGAALLVMLVLVLLLFWVAARLSCTTAVMASRRTFNLLTGMAESWRITAPAQWRIMGFLALAGLLLCFGFIILGGVAGVSMAATLQQGGQPQGFGIAQAIAGLVVGIPFAYLTVLVPAGIYRELTPFVPEQEIFA